MLFKMLAASAVAILAGGIAGATTLSEDFNSGTLNGFSVINFGAGTVVNGGPDGVSDPYLSIEDTGSGFMQVLFNATWTGDLSGFDEGIFSVDFIQMDQAAGGGYLPSFGELIIMGGGRTIGADLVTVDPTDVWQSASATINAATFGVTQAQWLETLSDVTQIGFRVESWSNPSETVGVDNFNLASTMTPVPLPAGGILLLSGLGLMAMRRRRKT